MPHTPFLSVTTLASTFPEPEFDQHEKKQWILARGQTVAVRPGRVPSVIWDTDPASSGSRDGNPVYLGMMENIPCYATDYPAGVPLPAGVFFSGARELFGKIPEHEVALAAYAIRILDYDRTTRFCGRCGMATRPLRSERAKLCTDCNRIVYPRISPAIIVLIKKGDEVLLARSPRFPETVYSVIAGFVEPGENLEAAVHREVHEEVGIMVENIRYFGSEPWPFPDSLMLGLVADYAGGEITIDNHEIEDAGWFGRESLPSLPSHMSISRALIEAWRRGDI